MDSLAHWSGNRESKRKRVKTKHPTYRELYLRAYAAHAQEEGKYQRLLFLTRKIAKAIPVGHKVLKDWNDYERQVEESENQ